jgi:hypothetical protein
MKKIFIFIIVILFFNFLIFPLGMYSYAKTLWKWEYDCMIVYVNNYYPKWESYVYTTTESNHVDKRWLENEMTKSIGLVDWCIYKTDDLYYNLINSNYCYIALFIEKYLLKN